jgi:hypothetical protein
MDSDNAVLTLWSHGLAGLLYTLFPLGLVARGYLRAPRERLRPVLLLALVASAVWAWMLVAAVAAEDYRLLRLATLADTVRYGAWYWFLLALLRQRAENPQGNSLPLLRWGSLAVILFAILVQFLTASSEAAIELLRKLRLFSALALPVTAMVLLEQFFRNASEDSRWNIKPCAWAWAAPSCSTSTCTPSRCCSTSSIRTPSASAVPCMRWSCPSSCCPPPGAATGCPRSRSRAGSLSTPPR